MEVTDKRDRTEVGGYCTVLSRDCAKLPLPRPRALSGFVHHFVISFGDAPLQLASLPFPRLCSFGVAVFRCFGEWQAMLAVSRELSFCRFDLIMCTVMVLCFLVCALL